MDLSLVVATEDDRPVMRRLIELYRYDLSESDGADVDSHGVYGYRYLDHYWTDDARMPFLFRVDGRWAGFGLVRAERPIDMAEFFVMRKYRRQGIGRVAAAELFRRFPGSWVVRQQNTNPAATAFWRRAIPYAYAESAAGDEVIQTFDSSSPAETHRRHEPGRSVIPTSSVVIRSGVEMDLPAVLSVWKDAATEATNTDDLEALRTLISHDPGALLVAEADGLIIGTVIGAWDGWRGSVYRLAVHPENRRSGLGRRLLGAAEAAMEGRGCRRAQAIVVDTDNQAIAFWSSTAWHPQEHRSRFVRG